MIQKKSQRRDTQQSPEASPAGILDRREFIRGAAFPSAVAAASAPVWLEGVRAQETRGGPQRPAPGRPELFVGLQMGPHTLLDEGIPHTLDLIRETAAVNAVLVYSHSFHGDLSKPTQFLAADHGVPLRETHNRKFPSIWVRQHEKYFQNGRLRPRPVDPGLEYADRDLFAELAEPTRKRGMQLYARVLESSGRAIENFSEVVTVDVYGRRTTVGCWSHPDYRAYWAATAEDLFRSYDLDGLQWGAERMGPLMNVIMPWNDTPPTCFCTHCQTRGRSRGIDVERARSGYEQLYVYVRGMMAGRQKPADGIFTGFLRLLLRYPEILAWEYQYRLSREEMTQLIYKTIKAIKPEAQVGWHVDHQPSSWDLVYRAELSYEEMAPYSDFIKFIAYHDVLGPRIRWWYLERLKKTVLREIPLQQSLDLYYDLFGYDKQVEPKLDQLATTGLSPEYVFRETQRSVASAAGKTRIYTGIGFDVPWGSEHIPADPEKVAQAVSRALDAGAAGIVVSREYEEMRLANLKAVGRALRERVKSQNG